MVISIIHDVTNRARTDEARDRPVWVGIRQGIQPQVFRSAVAPRTRTRLAPTPRAGGHLAQGLGVAGAPQHARRGRGHRLKRAGAPAHMGLLDGEAAANGHAGRGAIFKFKRVVGDVLAGGVTGWPRRRQGFWFRRAIFHVVQDLLQLALYIHLLRQTNKTGDAIKYPAGKFH